jgi:hypothetical protein
MTCGEAAHFFRRKHEPLRGSFVRWIPDLRSASLHLSGKGGERVAYTKSRKG